MLILLGRCSSSRNLGSLPILTVLRDVPQVGEDFMHELLVNGLPGVVCWSSVRCWGLRVNQRPCVHIAELFL